MKDKNILDLTIKQKSEELLQTIRDDTDVNIEGLVTDDDYSEIVGRNCENIVGYKKIPMGVSNRSVIINRRKFFVPICTTEGALVASMCRGIKLINTSGGVNGYVENLGITRGFSMEFDDFDEAITFYRWLKYQENINELKRVGEMNSRYCKIKSITSKNVFGSMVFVKVTAFTGDAMGMNMITKACDQIAKRICEIFFNARLVCISANTCTDKKWSVENYCNGRGRRVFLNLKIKESDLKAVMKVSIDELLLVYHSKIVIGSSLVLGGFNCQAANYVAATFLAFGQDLGHIIESSNCIITMNRVDDCLSVCLNMPSLVVGTVGGGTHLEPAKSMLKQFNYVDDHIIADEEDNSTSSNYLALLIASAVLAGEISCLASIAENSLLDAHLRLNRKH
ncbi:3-hydroxy-3-methylglutaryl-coenzyme A reductase [Nosema granulosis]|uniref:hydroxymethylglutaryl-CoA reductase (NADPH) n=1 Tax=Nosema granulosis TaxID=83296 RepID=A0A9P6GXX9_9MICR|nr:3-hydroxy-3-methylglutaryl-coenzyme A reductase [Nosema granulosis]